MQLYHNYLGKSLYLYASFGLRTMSKSKIHYNPKFSIAENAVKNGVSVSLIRYYIKVNHIDRRYEAKVAIIEEGRSYLKKHPEATRAEVSRKTHHSINTIREYWSYISTENELSIFDKKKSKKRLLRQFNNFYATHPSAVQDLLRVESFNQEILEPFCGVGSMSKVLIANGYSVESYDIVDRGFGNVADFFNLDIEKGYFDIITNPPYDDNFGEIVQLCLELCKRKVALLLPLRYLSSRSRFNSIYSITPPSYVYVYMDRLCIAKNADFLTYHDRGANLEIYAWFVWDKSYYGETLLRWIKNDTENFKTI